MATDPTLVNNVIDHYTPKLAEALKSGNDISPVLRGIQIDSWLAGLQNSANKSATVAKALPSAGLDLGAPDDAEVGWATTADIPGDILPSALAIRLSDIPDYAATLLSSDEDPDVQADTTTRTFAHVGAENAAQAAYSAAGIDQWNVELDGDNPCPLCEEAESEGPYDVGDGPDSPFTPSASASPHPWTVPPNPVHGTGSTTGEPLCQRSTTPTT